MGDFRQIFPVVPKVVSEDIISTSLRRSYIWRHVKVLSLSQNMRLSNINSDSAKFAKTLLEIGTNPEETIRLPSTINQSQTLEELICSIYPRLQEFETVSTSYLTERTILSARNDDVSSINTRALEMMHGKEIVYLAAYILSKEDSDDRTITNRSGELPFTMTRRQFPLRLSFAMTISKSQGQSVKVVGIDLRTPIFSHGQLYVALSRCRSPNIISVLLPPGDDTTTNIIYPNVLLEVINFYNPFLTFIILLGRVS
ncbi:hypothetical protein GIB67_029291 [Kingdonia uniflora]|uniref:ATP-dependent DNA helicase n=1 Tax=Kingdonia uniflora TaxID=39325 RepID=A0A7J7N8U1_9MAGN|nr:hypothetical protein GIB67_029291 [Kingdonia uniflora]